MSRASLRNRRCARGSTAVVQGCWISSARTDARVSSWTMDSSMRAGASFVMIAGSAVRCGSCKFIQSSRVWQAPHYRLRVYSCQLPRLLYSFAAHIEAAWARRIGARDRRVRNAGPAATAGPARQSLCCAGSAIRSSFHHAGFAGVSAEDGKPGTASRDALYGRPSNHGHAVGRQSVPAPHRRSARSGHLHLALRPRRASRANITIAAPAGLSAFPPCPAAGHGRHS